MLNIHPSLLPAFPGLNTHERALAAGVKIAGCTVHVVRADVDDGPIIAQAAVPVLDWDTAEIAGRARACRRSTGSIRKHWPFSPRARCGSGTNVRGPQVPVNQEKALFWPPLKRVLEA